MRWEQAFSGYPKRLARQISSQHEGFARAIANDPDDTLTTLIYADFLDEEGMHAMAGHLRQVAESHLNRPSAVYTKGSPTINHYHMGHGDPELPLTVYRFGGSLTGTDKVSVRSPHPEGGSKISWDTGDLAPENARSLVNSLAEEGHPLGNDYAKAAVENDPPDS